MYLFISLAFVLLATLSCRSISQYQVVFHYFEKDGTSFKDVKYKAYNLKGHVYDETSLESLKKQFALDDYIIYDFFYLPEGFKYTSPDNMPKLENNDWVNFSNTLKFEKYEVYTYYTKKYKSILMILVVLKIFYLKALTKTKFPHTKLKILQ